MNIMLCLPRVNGNGGLPPRNHHAKQPVTTIGIASSAYSLSPRIFVYARMRERILRSHHAALFASLPITHGASSPLFALLVLLCALGGCSGALARLAAVALRTYNRGSAYRTCA